MGEADDLSEEDAKPPAPCHLTAAQKASEQKAISLKTKEHMYEANAKKLEANVNKIKNALKEAEDKEKAEVDEADGHFKAAQKMEAEAHALKAAQAAAAKQAKCQGKKCRDAHKKKAEAAGHDAAKK